MANTVEKYCGRWFRNESGPTMLVLVGPSGVGKTHVAACIYTWSCRLAMKAYEAGGWDMIGRIPSSTYARWPEVADAFKEGQYGILDELVKSDLVVLDDIGAEHDPSKNAADKLCQVLSQREHRYTVVTTNIDPIAWPTKFDTRIADRLLRNSVIINLTDVTPYSLL